MSYVLSDGVVLPAWPDEIFTEEYPYFTIYQDFNLSEDADGNFVVTLISGRYIALSTTQPFVAAPDELTGAGFVMCMSFGNAGIYGAYENGWTFGGGESTDVEFVGDAVRWANHDIYVGTGVDDSGNPVVGTEIYFPNSTAKPPFVLPDGTELPALPDGWSDGRPYGFIQDVDGIYMFATAEHPMFIVSAELAPSGSAVEDFGVMSDVGAGASWAYGEMISPNGWMEITNTVYDTPELGSPWAEATVWTNHDMLLATAANDDGSYTIGTEVARKSDVNYRVTEGWMTSIANEARRLGESEEAMKPDAILNIYKSIIASVAEVSS